jgi:hypothetical protein
MVLRALLFIKGVDFQPAVIGGIAGGQIMQLTPAFAGRARRAAGSGNRDRAGKTRLRLFRQRQSVAGDILIRSVEQRQIRGVAETNIVRQIVAENSFTLSKTMRLPDQGNAWCASWRKSTV